MKLGIGSYTLTWSVGVPGYPLPAHPLSASDLLCIAHEHGIRLVQLADNVPLHRMLPEELLSLRHKAVELGIALELGTRGTEPAHLLQYLQIARLLNAGLVRTLITSSDLAEPLRQLREVLPQFEEAGMPIAIENHGLHTTGQLAALFDEIDHPLVGCCLDTVNSFSALDSPSTVVRDLIPYLINLHIKDFDIARADHQMGFVVLGKPAGYGKLDIKGLLEGAHRQGKRATAILELWTPYQDSIEETVRLERQWLEQSLAYLAGLKLTR